MARVRRRSPKVYTRGINPLNFGGNGRLARAQAAVSASQYLNMLVGRRRKILATASYSGFTGASGTREAFRWRVRTSRATRAIRAVILAIPCDSATSVNPYFQFTVATTVGSTQSYARIPVNTRDTGTIVPDDYFVLTQTLNKETNLTAGYQINPSTVYDIVLSATNFARAYSVTLYEETDEFFGVTERAIDYHTGVGPSTSVSGSRALLQDASRSVATKDAFDSSYLGSPVTIAGFTGGDAGNNGTFIIDGVTGESVITFVNAAATVAAFTPSCTYSIGDLAARIPGVMQEILDEDLADWNEVAYGLHQEQGGHLISWSDPINTIASGSSGTTYYNLHDTSLSGAGAYAESSPGHWVWPEKMGTYESSLLPCVFWAYAKNSAGALAAHVKLQDTAGDISGADISVTSTTAALYTVNCSIATTAADYKIAIVGNGNLTGFATVYAYGLYSYGT